MVCTSAKPIHRQEQKPTQTGVERARRPSSPSQNRPNTSTTSTAVPTRGTEHFQRYQAPGSYRYIAWMQVPITEKRRRDVKHRTKIIFSVNPCFENRNDCCAA